MEKFELKVKTLYTSIVYIYNFSLNNIYRIILIGLFMFSLIAAELGDYDPTEHGEEYISELKLLLKQTPEIEAKVAEHHRTTMHGLTPEQAETSFLKQAYQLDTYGVDPHPVKVCVRFPAPPSIHPSIHPFIITFILCHSLK